MATPDAARHVSSIAVAATAELGERPVWDDVRGELVWVDVLAGVVHRHIPGGEDRSFAVRSTVGAVGLRAGGGYVLAAGDAFCLVDERGRAEGSAIRLPGIPTSIRFNDGAVDPAGRFWAGTTSLTGARGSGALHCLEVGGVVRTVLRGVTESNGIAWSPDSRTMYYVDSGDQAIRAYDFDLASGTPSNPRTFTWIDEDAGVPDGLVVDASGAVWVALWGGSAVRCYSPAGILISVVDLPVSRVTCPGFGGSELTDLYVTTAWEGATQEERAAEPSAGSIFRVTGVGPGLPTARFAG
jgi:sugar lactone lactonase YvrE